MANVGDQLTQPEAGWRRYDDSDNRVKYSGTWSHGTNSALHMQTESYSNELGASLTFKFIGSNIRLISSLNTNRSSNIEVSVDGIKTVISMVGSGVVNYTLIYEKVNLTNTEHEVKITLLGSGYVQLDAIDINSSGELLPSTKPATTGKLCNSLDEMNIGDYIVWKRDGNTHSFGGSIDDYIEIPTTGVASSSLPTKHFYYAIKVDTGLLISDRVTEHSISWDTLNSQKKIQGLPVTISGVSGVIRSLTGGVAYADENGNKSMTNLNKGSFPTNNEWDKYIINFPNTKIQTGKSLEDVWHYLDIYTLPQDTSSNGVYTSSDGTSSATVNSTFRTMRGKSGIWGDFGIRQSSNSATDAGLRPVFEWKEV